jgi:hypothetical protein
MSLDQRVAYERVLAVKYMNVRAAYTDPLDLYLNLAFAWGGNFGIFKIDLAG